MPVSETAGSSGYAPRSGALPSSSGRAAEGPHVAGLARVEIVPAAPAVRMNRSSWLMTICCPTCLRTEGGQRSPASRLPQASPAELGGRHDDITRRAERDGRLVVDTGPKCPRGQSDAARCRMSLLSKPHVSDRVQRDQLLPVGAEACARDIILRGRGLRVCGFARGVEERGCAGPRSRRPCHSARTSASPLAQAWRGASAEGEGPSRRDVRDRVAFGQYELPIRKDALPLCTDDGRRTGAVGARDGQESSGCRLEDSVRSVFARGHDALAVGAERSARDSRWVSKRDPTLLSVSASQTCAAFPGPAMTISGPFGAEVRTSALPPCQERSRAVPLRRVPEARSPVRARGRDQPSVGAERRRVESASPCPRRMRTRPRVRPSRLAPFPSWLAVTTCAPSGLNDAPKTKPVCPRRMRGCSGVRTSQILAVLSTPVVTMRSPSGLKAALRTGSPCPSVTNGFPFRVQIRASRRRLRSRSVRRRG